MKQRMLDAVLAAIGLSVTAAAAVAQVAPPSAMLPNYEIATIVRSAGFTPLSPAMRRGETYVLRAAGPDGREMRLVVDARSGGIMSAVPVVAAARERMGPYEPSPRGGYIPPEPRGIYESGPPVVYEGDRPLNYERRPMAPIPNAPRGARAAVPDATDDQPLADPPVIIAPERGEHGLLPPPPERFPQRAAPPPAKPAAKPAPVKRAAAAATPLPKPKPAAQPAAQPAAPDGGAAAAPPSAPANSPDPRALPH